MMPTRQGDRRDRPLVVGEPFVVAEDERYIFPEQDSWPGSDPMGPA
jgi:hypothetical protein